MAHEMKVLICPDKFKGSLDALAVAEAIAQGWRRARPDDDLTLRPISDGGDGFGSLMGRQLSLTPLALPTTDAAGRPISGEAWIGSGIGVFETATVIGLAHLPPGRFHPFDLDTRGLGSAFRTLHSQDARRLVVGIGGSATNDGGFGLAMATGWRFVDRDGNPIERWTDLERLHALEEPDAPTRFDRVDIAADVTNPLLGPEGASRIYGPQKGLQESDFGKAEACLGRLAEVVDAHLDTPFSTRPGAGAAGGLGFALAAFLGGAFRSGFDLFAAAVGLRETIQEADIIVSGEGGIDASTEMGKGVGGVLDLGKDFEKPFVLIGGQADRAALSAELRPRVWTLIEAVGESEAFANTRNALHTLAESVATTLAS